MLRILIVEDDQVQLELMSDVLSPAFENAAIHLAKTYGEAIAVMQELLAVSVVVTDYKLPEGKTGYDVLAYCQDHMTDVPVIIVTGYGRDEHEEVRPGLSFRKGAADFVHKPIIGKDEAEELVERVRKAIETSEKLA